MFCPLCHGGTKVLDSREGRGSVGETRRRRACNGCGHRFTTKERIEETLPMVTKRSGDLQPFDRRRVYRSFEIACRKRPISSETIEETAIQVEQWAATQGGGDLHSEQIGGRIAHILYTMDPVAYVRFVSVYRSFNSVEEFEHLLHEMEKSEKVDLAGQRTLFDPALRNTQK